MPQGAPICMKKTGVLEFRYSNFKNLAKRLRRKGSYTINIGDWIRDDLPDLIWPALVMANEGTSAAHATRVPV